MPLLCHQVTPPTRFPTSKNSDLYRSGKTGGSVKKTPRSCGTVDGSEILHQLVGNISRCLQGLYFPGDAGFLPSTVVSFSMESCSVSKLEGVTVHRATSFHEVYPHLCRYVLVTLDQFDKYP